jgi:hypothetical protein
MSEADPTGANAHEPGAKLDAGKAPIMRGVIQYFPRALKAVSDVSAAGAKKYTWRGWATVPDGVARYSDAMGRHLIAEQFEQIDKDTGCLHAAQVAWNALARLELLLEENETAQRMLRVVSDDFVADYYRGKPGC